MKKFLYGSLLYFLALLTGCSNEEELISGNIGSNSYVLKVRVENTVGTRTTVNESNQVLWVEGDTIGVFMEGASVSVPFIYSGMTGDVANFTGDMPEGKPVAAFYPYNETAELEEGSLSVILPNTYAYTGNSNGPMLGLPDGEDGLYFKHLWGLLKVTIEDIPAEAEKLVVEANYWDSNLYSYFIIDDIEDTEAILKGNSYGDYHVVTYNFTSDMLGQTETFYIPLPTGAYSSALKVKLQNAKGDNLWYKPAKPTIQRGTICELPVIDAIEPIAVITSHENEYSFSGYETYTTLNLKGIIKNFYMVDEVGIQLVSEPNYRHEYYFAYGGAKYLDGRERKFEQTVDVYPGKNTYTISWNGKGTDYCEVKGDTTFVVYYEETPVIADAVDMGLSVKWASHNIGASKTTEYGGLYIWGDITGTDLRLEDENCYGESGGPDIISGNPMYDIATAKWGGKWRMPTKEEMKELLTNTSQEFVTINEVKGVLFTSRITGNKLFFPAAGFNYGYHDLRSRGTGGRYWSGEGYYDIFQHMDSELFALTYEGNDENMLEIMDIMMTYYTFGCSVRPVYGDIPK